VTEEGLKEIRLNEEIFYNLYGELKDKLVAIKEAF